MLSGCGGAFRLDTLEEPGELLDNLARLKSVPVLRGSVVTAESELVEPHTLKAMGSSLATIVDKLVLQTLLALLPDSQAALSMARKPEAVVVTRELLETMLAALPSLKVTYVWGEESWTRTESGTKASQLGKTELGTEVLRGIVTEASRRTETAALTERELLTKALLQLALRVVLTTRGLLLGTSRMEAASPTLTGTTPEPALLVLQETLLTLVVSD